MTMRVQLPSTRQLVFLLLSVAIGLVVMLAVDYRVFGLNREMSLDEMRKAISTTTDYKSILVVNALVGASVVLFILELKWDALRVTLTVAFALAIGYVVTAAFNVDAASPLDKGEFRVDLRAEKSTIAYDGEITADFTTGDDGVQSYAYDFLGTAGDVISIYAYAAEDSPVDVQFTLTGPGDVVLAEQRNATPEQMVEVRKIVTELDAALENFELPADGFYTITIAQGGEPIEGEFTLELAAESTATAMAVDMFYGGSKGGDFNKEGAADKLSEVTYYFAGAGGDVIDILAYAARGNVKVDLEVALLDADGNELAKSVDTTDEQVAANKPALKSTRDAIIEQYELPADGIYAIYARPEPVTTELKIREMIRVTNLAYDAFLLGPLDALNRWGIWWIQQGMTLILLGLAIVLVFRAEQFSLGAEGQLFLGALVSAVLALSFSDTPRILLVPLCLLSAATVGFLWGLLPGALKAYLGANELVSTLMLNTVAVRFYEMVLTHQLTPPDAGQTASEVIPVNGLLNSIIDIKGEPVTIAVYLVIAITILTWLIIQRTPTGYEIRMIGSNQKFADYGGVNTKRTIMLAMALSGAVAGLAGAHIVMGSSYRSRLVLALSAGLGFEGIVVALLARNNPLVVPFTGLMYQYLRAGARAMEASDADVSFQVVRIIQGIIILLITAEALVTFFQRRRTRRRGTIDLDADSGQPLGPPGESPPRDAMTPGSSKEAAHV